jgi:hypothetical protein
MSNLFPRMQGLAAILLDAAPRARLLKNREQRCDYCDTCFRSSDTSRSVICDALLPKRAVT